MRIQSEVIKSELNEVGRNFDYRKKEITFELFKSFFDNTTFTQYNDGFMGWGEHESNCQTLFVSTASFDGRCFLRHVRHKTKANNPYNNFVNAIAYWDYLNDKGKEFFMAFYSHEIAMQKATISLKISELKNQIKALNDKKARIEAEVIELTPSKINH